jgi:hypothetical protein
MADGFLGYPSTFMLDVVVCALVLVVPALIYSIYLAKFKRAYLQHRNLQTMLGAILFITVLLFELDMRMHGGWVQIVNRSQRLTPEQLPMIRQILYVHLVFAISTVALWILTLFWAWRRFPNPPTPGPHSRLHKTLGWISAIDITLTSITGLIWYYVAFVR